MRVSTANPVVRALRPEPHRGDQVAAGVVVLATLLLLVEVRFASAWGDGARFVVAALAAGFVGAMAHLSPLESDRPRSYQTVLYVTTCLLTLLALIPLSALLGARDFDGAGAITWVMLLVGGLALTFSLSRNSAYCTLVAALAFTFCLQAAVAWIFEPDGTSTARWVFLLVILADLLGAVMLRDRRRRHAVMLADAAGLAVLGLALTLAPSLVPDAPGLVFDQSGDSIVTLAVASLPWGWALVGFGAGFGLIAYAGADREPGPGYIGVACLVAFAYLAGVRGEATLLGWPIVLALVAGAFLVLGLRPSHPLPPEPIEDVGEEPRAVPLPTPPERRPGALWQRLRPDTAETAVAEVAPIVPPVASPAAAEPVPPVTPEPAPPVDVVPEPEAAPSPVEPRPVVEPVDPRLPAPATAAAAETVVSAEPEPATEPATEAMPVIEPTPEPVAEPETQSASAPVVEPTAEQAAEPDPEAEPVVEAEPAPDPEPAPEPPTEPQLRPLPSPRPGQGPRLAPHPHAEDEPTRVYPTLDDEDEL